MSKHVASEDDEDLLFQKGITMIESKCKRCETPILLLRKADDIEYYYVTEKPVQRK